MRTSILRACPYPAKSSSIKRQHALAELKIDKSFVDGLGGDDESDQAISMAILGMAKALKIRTVGEGVETQAQPAWLARNGCDFVQGYLLSRPLTLDDYTQLISSRSGYSS